MPFWAAVVYGLLQGVTEFLPISSSGHLKIAHRLGLARLAGNAEQAFDVLLHLASLVAIVVVFRRELRAVCRLRPRLHLCLILGILPAGLLGLVAGDLIQAVGAEWLGLGLAYCFTAALLFYAHVRSAGARSDPPPSAGELTVSPGQALTVGLLQMPALFGGVSRSGATVAGGLLAGMAPETAVAFSFLVGIPLIAGAALKKSWDGGFVELVEAVGPTTLVLACAVCLGASLAGLVLLKLVVRRRHLHIFAAYCGALAVLCLAMAL